MINPLLLRSKMGAELQSHPARVQRLRPVSHVNELPRLNPMDRGLKVKRFALSNDRPDSITILEHLDYFKRIYMRDPYVRYVSVGLMPCLANNAVRDQISII